MVAGSNRLRRQLNDAAREALHRRGGLDGPALLIAGREFQAGDEVVARRNAPGLAGVAGEWVKNGSLGTVLAVDDEARTVSVAFDREGTLVVPEDYLEGGHLEHAYARTTYGLQGATVETTAYQPTDASGFEEGYVALTRARQGTTVHVVDGEAEADPELDGHGTEVAVTGLAHVARALGGRRANTLASDVDANAALALEFHGWDLRALDAEICRLDRLLAAAPPEVGTALARAERRLRGLEARLDRRHPGRGSPRRDHARHGLLRAVDLARGEVGRLSEADDRRREWLRNHQGDLTRRAGVRRAISTRIEQMGLAVRSAPDERVVSVLGERPDSPFARARWNRAATELRARSERGETLVPAKRNAPVLLGDCV